MIERSDLVERVQTARARIIRLTSPAGYGKSTLTRSLAQRFPSSAVCDCTGIASVTDFSHRIIVALARETPERAEQLAQRELSAGSDERAIVNVTVHEWMMPGEESLFVFENAEHLAELPLICSLFIDLLTANSKSRTIAICSRVTLPLQFGRVAAPHEMVSLGVSDLRLRDDEIREVFAGASVSGEALARVIQLSRGWAIAVFLLARFAREGRLEATLDKFDDVAFDDLHEYLATEVLADLPADDLDALLACASIPRAGAEDVARAVGNPRAPNVLRDLTHRLPFLSRVAEDVFEVDPLIATTLRTRHPQRCTEILERAASSWLRDRNFARAAKLYLALGDREAAANAVEQAEAGFLTTPSIEFADVVASLDERTMSKHPQIWGAAMLWRSQSIEPREWVRQSEAVWTSLPPSASPTLKGSIVGVYFGALTNLGRSADAEQLLATFEQQLGPGDAAGRAVIDLLRLDLETLFKGRYSAIDSVAPHLQSMLMSSDISNAYFLSQLAGHVHAARGEFDLGRNVFDRAIELIMRSNVPQAQAMVLSHAVSFEWIAGDAEAFEQRLSALERLIEPSIAKAYTFFLDCARGRGDSSHVGFEKLERRTIAYFMAASTASSADDAARYARLAATTSAEGAQPFLRVLALAALAELVASERRKLLKEAAKISSSVESQPLRTAIASLRDGSGPFGMLAPFIGRFRRYSAVAGHAIEVARIPAAAQLSKREREVAALIAQGKSKKEIGSALIISDRNVENHIASIFNKLGIGSRAALAAYVASQGETARRE